MPETPRTLGRTFWSLFLALLNATLILVALCLWLGWHVLSEARAVSGALSGGLERLDPLTAEVSGLRAEVAGLRADLAVAEAQGGGSPALAQLAGRVADLDARVTASFGQIEALAADPGLLVDRAVDRAALQIRQGIAACTPDGA